MRIEFINPSDWPRPSGYSHAAVAQGPLIFVSGQLGCDYVSGGFDQEFLTQVRFALQNILRILHEAGSSPEKIVKMVWYVISKSEYLDCAVEVGLAYREIIGSHFPAMTLVEVSSLLSAKAKIEIEAIAIL